MVVQKVGMVTLVMTVGGASSRVQGSAGISQSRCSVSDLLVELPSPEKWNQLQKKKKMIGHQSHCNGNFMDLMFLLRTKNLKHKIDFFFICTLFKTVSFFFF